MNLVCFLGFLYTCSLFCITTKCKLRFRSVESRLLRYPSRSLGKSTGQRETRKVTQKLWFSYSRLVTITGKPEIVLFAGLLSFLRRYRYSLSSPLLIKQLEGITPAKRLLAFLTWKKMLKLRVFDNKSWPLLWNLVKSSFLRFQKPSHFWNINELKSNYSKMKVFLCFSLRNIHWDY